MKFWRLQAIISELNLGKDDVFIDIGGYHGEATRWVRKMYDSFCVIYEPNPEWFKMCLEEFKYDWKVKVFPYALGKGNRVAFLSQQDDGSNIYSLEGIQIQVKDANEVLKFKPTVIKMNIEGAEYEVLETLKELAPKMLIQFHKGTVELPTNYKRVWDKPRKTWELWQRF